MATMKPRPDPHVKGGLGFLYSVRDRKKPEYYEVKDKWEKEYKVFNQTQYLLSILFNTVGEGDRSREIRSLHRPEDADNDPGRKGHLAGDRWCVLEGRTDLFYLAHHAREGVTEGKGNDEIALMALYCLLKAEGPQDPQDRSVNFRQKAEDYWNMLKKRYDPSTGVLEADIADLTDASKHKRPVEYPVYKVALLGILAKRMNDTRILESVRGNLRSWRQKTIGGWQTERTLELKLSGQVNCETTSLAILALADC
jgi:hypothetical protein